MNEAKWTNVKKLLVIKLRERGREREGGRDLPEGQSATKAQQQGVFEVVVSSGGKQAQHALSSLSLLLHSSIP